MRLAPRLVVNLIVVLLLGVVTVGWVLASLVGEGPGGGPFRVTTDFASSGGVFSNQEVTYRGVLVGRVGDMRLNDDGVDIELLIDREWLGRIPADSVASIRSKSAVGEQYVNLTPLSSVGEMLTDGDTIARSNTDLPVEFQDLLRSLDRVLAEVPPETTRRVIEDLAGGIGGRSEDIATILRSLGTLAEGFASVAPEQKRLLDNAPRAGAEFLRTKENFSAAIAAADEALAPLADQARLEALFAANDRFAREGVALLARHGDNLASGIEGLADLMTFQVENREAILGSLEHLPGFLHAVEDASIPWESPDGRRFYRIRTGLIFQNVPSSWPCPYQVPHDYTRLPHVRREKRVVTDLRCRTDEVDAGDEAALADAIATALAGWADKSEERTAASASVDVGSPAVWDRPGMTFLSLGR